MPEEELAALADDIAANGQRDPVVLLKGSLLDGKTRWTACNLRDIAPLIREFGSDPNDGTDPVRFVLSKNHHRRHMTYPQKCFAAASVATLLHGSNRFTAKLETPNGISTLSLGEAAEAFGVGIGGVRDARVINEDAEPEVKAEVLNGKKAIRQIADALRKKRSKLKMKKKPEKPIVLPYLKLEVATAEETERPPPGAPLADILAWRDKIGAKVPLYSMSAKQMMDAQHVVEDFAAGVRKLASQHTCDAEIFYTLVAQMLRHVVKRDSKSGDQIDFARAARAAQAAVEDNLETVIAKLEGFRPRLKNKNLL